MSLFKHALRKLDFDPVVCNMKISFDFSTVISLLALIVSAISLFYSQLRPPSISSVVGPEIRIYYPPDGGFGIYMPATFLNQSPRTGTIRRCAITLYPKNNSEERFFMDWRYFFRLKPDGLGFEMEQIASAFAIPESQSVSKLIWFTWRSNSTPPLQIAAGEYVLVFHYWTGLTGMPHNDFHEFFIDDQTHVELDQARIVKSPRAFEIVLDKTIGPNRVMTSSESKSLLGF
jgi:hypothetical protein